MLLSFASALAQSSSIFLQNNTSLDLHVSVVQSGTHTMSASEWDLKATDMYPWEMQKEIHWEEIFRSNVEVLITNLWREEYWGDVRRLEKNDIVIYVRFYADNRLVFYLESMG